MVRQAMRQGYHDPGEPSREVQILENEPRGNILVVCQFGAESTLVLIFKSCISFVVAAFSPLVPRDPWGLYREGGGFSTMI